MQVKAVINGETFESHSWINLRIAIHDDLLSLDLFYFNRTSFAPFLDERSL